MAGGILFSFCALFLAAAKMERPSFYFYCGGYYFASLFLPPLINVPAKKKSAKEETRPALFYFLTAFIFGLAQK